MPILFVNGVNDQSLMKVRLDEQGKLAFAYDGTCGVREKLTLPPAAAQALMLFGRNVVQHGIRLEEKPSLIFNQISDPDTHTGALERCVQLCDKAGVPVINHPSAVLRTTRDRVSETLQGITGVTVPRSIRFTPKSPADVLATAEKQGFDFPVIVREAGAHGGTRTTRIQDRRDRDSMYVHRFDGRAFYLSEFVDCSDREGHYHKQRLVHIDGEVLLRHMMYGKHWSVHADSRDYMHSRETWEEHLEKVRRFEEGMLPRVRPAVEEIAKRLELEYFGIDCSIGADGTMLLFEANANMNILFNKYSPLDGLIEQTKRTIVEMLERRSGITLAA